MDFPPSLFLLLKELNILKFVGLPTKVADPRVSLSLFLQGWKDVI